MSYFKIIGNNNGNYPYRIGINTLKYNGEVFNTTEECGPGGLYYTTIEYIFGYADYGNVVCRLSLPEDAQIIDVGDKSKSDKIIIEEMLPLWDVNTIQYLVSLGANINTRKGNILIWSTIRGLLHIVHCLVSLGANVQNTNRYALQLAYINDHFDVVQYLISQGATVNDLFKQMEIQSLASSYQNYFGVMNYTNDILTVMYGFEGFNKEDGKGSDKEDDVYGKGSNIMSMSTLHSRTFDIFDRRSDENYIVISRNHGHTIEEYKTEYKIAHKGNTMYKGYVDCRTVLYVFQNGTVLPSTKNVCDEEDYGL